MDATKNDETTESIIETETIEIPADEVSSPENASPGSENFASVDNAEEEENTISEEKLADEVSPPETLSPESENIASVGNGEEEERKETSDEEVTNEVLSPENPSPASENLASVDETEEERKKISEKKLTEENKRGENTIASENQSNAENFPENQTDEDASYCGLCSTDDSLHKSMIEIDESREAEPPENELEKAGFISHENIHVSHNDIDPQKFIKRRLRQKKNINNSGFFSCCSTERIIEESTDSMVEEITESNSDETALIKGQEIKIVNSNYQTGDDTLYKSFAGRGYDEMLSDIASHGNMMRPTKSVMRTVDDLLYSKTPIYEAIFKNSFSKTLDDELHNEEALKPYLDVINKQEAGVFRDEMIKFLTTNTGLCKQKIIGLLTGIDFNFGHLSWLDGSDPNIIQNILIRDDGQSVFIRITMRKTNASNTWCGEDIPSSLYIEIYGRVSKNQAAREEIALLNTPYLDPELSEIMPHMEAYVHPHLSIKN